MKTLHCVKKTRRAHVRSYTVTADPSQTYGSDFKYLTDAQLIAEIERCEGCEDKPCMTACPTHVSPMDFIYQAKSLRPQDLKRAAAEIMSQNTFGGVCGAVCSDKFCMHACVRKDVDRPVDIPAIQATIIERAHRLGFFPKWQNQAKTSDQKIAVIGAGPAGLAVAATLTRKGFQVDVFEKKPFAGGKTNTIPPSRLPRHIITDDVKWIQSLGLLDIKYNVTVNNPQDLLKDYSAVCVAAGLDPPKKLSIPNEDKVLYALDYLWTPEKFKGLNNVVVIGAGPVAVDCAITARHNGAQQVTLVSITGLEDMPLSEKERHHLVKYDVDIVCRTLPSEFCVDDKGKVVGLKCTRVSKPASKDRLFDVQRLPNTEQFWEADAVVMAIGNVRDTSLEVQNDKIFYCGDYTTGASTVVEATATGKNIGKEIFEFLSTGERKKSTGKLQMNGDRFTGYNFQPVKLETDFFGRKLINPFLLSASPMSDGYEQMKKAYEHGWAGGIMKTAFDGVHIHIPNEYMTKFGDQTFGNCDNVSDHTIDRVSAEIAKLVKEYPDRLTMASTGGSVTGVEDADKASWQGNTKKLEKSGAMAIEYSLSCPQGGLGSEGHEGGMASQDPLVTAKIVNWIMEVSDPNIPKFFKLSAAVTYIEAIVDAVQKVLKKYPNKKAGITLSNSFPVLNFRGQSDESKKWEEGIVYGMAGEGVAPISYLSLAKVANVDIKISGNGGVTDAMSAAHFLALGVQTVQVCTAASRHGYHVIRDLTEGLSHLMEERRISSVSELCGIAKPEPISDFMDLTPTKKVSHVKKELCIHCGNCSRCPYLAITLHEGIPATNPDLCIGCSLCVLQCPTHALEMVERKGSHQE